MPSHIAVGFIANCLLSRAGNRLNTFEANQRITRGEMILVSVSTCVLLRGLYPPFPLSATVSIETMQCAIVAETV